MTGEQREHRPAATLMGVLPICHLMQYAAKVNVERDPLQPAATLLTGTLMEMQNGLDRKMDAMQENGAKSVRC